jgi:hypothetical protein
MAEGSELAQNESEHSIRESDRIKDAVEEECFAEVLERMGEKDVDEEENGQQLDLFETGNIWTQVGSTQAQRKAWQNACNSHEEQFEPIDIDGGSKSANDEEDLQTSRDSEFYFDPSQDFPEDIDGVNTSTQVSQSLWKDGKTAPLLNQYGEERRLWYMAQAGIYDQTDSVHDANSRQATVNLTREPSSSPPIVVYQTPARPAIQNSRNNDGSSSTPAQTHLPTTIQPVTNGVTPQRRGPAFSLAGNLNTPNGAQNRTPILQTPKRKTWQSTWASREEAKDAAAAAQLEAKSSSVKKKKRNSNNTPKGVARGVKGGRGGGSSSKNATPNRTAGALPPGSARR